MHFGGFLNPHLGDLVHGPAPRLEGHPDGAGHVGEEPRRHLLERLTVDPLTQVDLLLYIQESRVNLTPFLFESHLCRMWSLHSSAYRRTLGLVRFVAPVGFLPLLQHSHNLGPAF